METEAHTNPYVAGGSSPPIQVVQARNGRLLVEVDPSRIARNNGKPGNQRISRVHAHKLLDAIVDAAQEGHGDVGERRPAEVVRDVAVMEALDGSDYFEVMEELREYQDDYPGPLAHELQRMAQEETARLTARMNEIADKYLKWNSQDFEERPAEGAP